VRYDLVSRQSAENAYGVLLADDLKVLVEATEKLRSARKAGRGELQRFDFGYTPPTRQAAE
jgi:N-methylhydantoinase B